MCDSFLNIAMQKCTIPNAQTLQKRFDQYGLTQFARDTDIIKKLANTKQYPFAIAISVESYLTDYIKKLSEEKKSDIVEKLQNTLFMKQNILGCILQDYPHDFNELKEKNLL